MSRSGARERPRGVCVLLCERVQGEGGMRERRGAAGGGGEAVLCMRDQKGGFVSVCSVRETKEGGGGGRGVAGVVCGF